MTRIVVVSDMQIPFHDQAAVANLITFVRDFEPDALVNVGDDIDALETAAWSRGTAAEYGGNLQDGFDAAKMVHAAFRDALGPNPYHVSRSNHGDRTRRYIAKYGPALSSLRCLDLGELLGYAENGITYHDRPWEIAPGWVCAHGDEGSLSPIAGRTAGLLAEKWGVSVVCGHSHRAGIQPVSRGYGGVVTNTHYGVECGHLMNMAKASYLQGGHGNWQQAFAILYCTPRHVTPVLVPVFYGGQFVVEGVQYGS